MVKKLETSIAGHTGGLATCHRSWHVLGSLREGLWKGGPEGPEEEAKRNLHPHFSDEVTEALQGGFCFAVVSS